MDENEKYITQAKIGQTWVNVYINLKATDAYYTIRRDVDQPNRMVIGFNQFEYEAVFMLLMHETVELALSQRNGTYYASSENHDYPAYVQFMFSHEQYQYAINEAAAFMMYVEPLLRDEWIKLNPDKPLRHIYCKET